MGDQGGELVDVLVAQGIISRAGTADAGALSRHPPSTSASRGLVESSWFVLASSSLSPPLRGLSASQKEGSAALLWVFQELPC